MTEPLDMSYLLPTRGYAKAWALQVEPGFCGEYARGAHLPYSPGGKGLREAASEPGSRLFLCQKRLGNGVFSYRVLVLNDPLAAKLKKLSDSPLGAPAWEAA